MGLLSAFGGAILGRAHENAKFPYRMRRPDATNGRSRIRCRANHAWIALLPPPTCWRQRSSRNRRLRSAASAAGWRLRCRRCGSSMPSTPDRRRIPTRTPRRAGGRSRPCLVDVRGPARGLRPARQPRRHARLRGAGGGAGPHGPAARRTAGEAAAARRPSPTSGRAGRGGCRGTASCERQNPT